MADAVDGVLKTDLKQRAGTGRSASPGPPLISSTVVTDNYWHRIGFVWDRDQVEFQDLCSLAFLRYFILFVVFLIGTVFSIMFLVVREFENWVEYQIIITLMVTIIFFMGFFFFSALHYIIRKG